MTPRFYRADITNPAQVERAIASVFGRFGRIDVLVNCAGIDRRGTVSGSSLEDWKRVIDVNLTGTFLVSKHVLRHMMAARRGSIINVASALALLPGTSMSAYCAAKAGVVALTRTMALDYAPFNIRVNCIAPGPTDTPLFRGAHRGVTVDTSARIGKRLARPEEIAGGILFLASESAEYVTGVTLPIDGGGVAGYNREHRTAPHEGRR